MHHIAVTMPNFRETLGNEAERGRELALSGTFSGVEVAFLATDRDLGVLLKVFSGLPRRTTPDDGDSASDGVAF